MRLQRLTSLEVEKVVAEIKQVRELIESLRELLGDRMKILAVVKRELADIARKYGDDRRTEVIATPITDIDLEDLIPEEGRRGSDHQPRHRSSGCRWRPFGDSHGAARAAPWPWPATTSYATCSSRRPTPTILFVTDTGKSYWVRVHELPDRTRSAIGQDLRSPARDDRGRAGHGGGLAHRVRPRHVPVHGDLPRCRQEGQDHRIHQRPHTRASSAINLDPDDRLVAAMLTDGSSDVVLATRMGYALRFSEYGIRSMGRATRGVRGMRAAPERCGGRAP